MLRHLLFSAAFVIVGLIPGPVKSEDDLLISGTYTENQACRGSDPGVSRVTIGANGIESSQFGFCAIRDRKREGNTFLFKVECKAAGGAVMLGDVSFTMKHNDTLDFADQDKTYRSVLHKCQP